jgi:amino acid adenylation domain-containing protein
MPYVFPQQEGQFDYSLEVTEKGGRLRGSLRFKTAIMSAASAKRMVDAYTHLLAEIARRPGALIDGLGMLSADSRREVLELSKSEVSICAGEASAISRFVAQCRERPDALAVRCGGVRLSYAELDRRSTELARYLVSLGLTNDALVGLYLHRSEDLLVGVWGVMKAGAAYLPLDPAFPAERLGYMLEDSGACLVLTESALAGSLPDKGVRAVCLDGREITEATGEEALHEPDPESRAYVIYTSGSTGKPKGVEVTHRNLANFLSSMAVEPGLTAADVLCAVTTLSFDISMLELLLPLTVGASVVLADRETAGDGRRLAALLADHKVTVMQATPSTWRLLLDSGWQGDGRLKVLCGGEALPGDLAAALLERAGEVWNMYGPTETTIWSSCGRVTDPGAVHIGRPIANTGLYVVDARGELQPPGVPGEIWIGGEGVARGYLGRPELTAERFLPDSFMPGGRLYRTGDRGRWRADGTLQHLGRLDNQVKVRGYRIEPGEIESCLAEHPDVRQCAVAMREARPGDQRLLAWYVAEGGRQTTVTSLRSHLKSLLPSYMIPQHFVEIDALPLTPNGKIDRSALPLPGGAPAAEDRFVPPASDAEKRLAALWQELLGVDRIGVNDNFFDLGGHSLLAARLVSRLQEQSGAQVTLQALTADTLGQIASSIATALPGEARAPAGDNARQSEGTPAGFIRRLLRRQGSGQP